MLPVQLDVLKAGKAFKSGQGGKGANEPQKMTVMHFYEPARIPAETGLPPHI